MTKSSLTYIDYYTISASQAGPHLLIIAGIHGDEFEPMISALYLMNSVKKKLVRGKVTILPVANILAYDLGRRCGVDHKDLARTLPGKEDGSPIELMANEISSLIRQSDYLIDLHTGGALFDIVPLTGYLLHPDKMVLEQQQAMARAFNLPVIWGTDAQVHGRTLSVARDFNIPAIYAECRGGVNVNTQTIRLYEDGCLNVMNYLGLIEPPANKRRKTQTWLEDYTPGQGHLQAKLPAPDCGIFVPCIPLGKEIKKGTLFGHIVNPLQHKKTEVIIEEEGILFMLRISSRVLAGDSLGGILPIVPKTKRIIYAP